MLRGYIAPQQVNGFAEDNFMLITEQKSKKIMYPICCKLCKKHITDIAISADLWDKKDAETLGVSNIKCNNCKEK